MFVQDVRNLLNSKIADLYFDRQIVNRRRLLEKHYKDIQETLKQGQASVEVRFGLDDERIVAKLDFLTKNYSPLEVVAIEFNSEEEIRAKLYFDKMRIVSLMLVILRLMILREKM